MKRASQCLTAMVLGLVLLGTATPTLADAG